MKRSRVGNSRREVLKGTRAGDEELEEGEWSKVSPKKVGRSPNKLDALKFCEVTILLKTRFSVLDIEEEDGGEKHDDDMEEKDLDTEIEKDVEET